VAGDQKKVVERSATLGFTDESGFLLMPLVCRTLARRGRTPRLVHRARQRDKVSVAAALTLSPERGRLGLHYQTYPDGYVDAEAYAAFLRRSVLRSFRGPVVLVHDGGTMHKGPHVRAVAEDHPRLEMHFLPSYAPEFNPAEPLWKHAKVDELGNYVPLDVPELDRAIHRCLDEASEDQDRLRSFFATAKLPWDGLPRLF
jgi:transposase